MSKLTDSVQQLLAKQKEEAVNSIAAMLVVDCIKHNFWPDYDANDVKEWAVDTFDMNQAGALANEHWHEEIMEILTLEMNERYYNLINSIQENAYEKTAKVLQNLHHDSETFNPECFNA